jgi:hypothetical protein
MSEYVVVVGMEPTFEYFCRDCRQLRLSFIDLDTCGNCGSSDIVKGPVGTLDKAKLKVEKP